MREVADILIAHLALRGSNIPSESDTYKTIEEALDCYEDKLIARDINEDMADYPEEEYPGETVILNKKQYYGYAYCIYDGYEKEEPLQRRYFICLNTFDLQEFIAKEKSRGLLNVCITDEKDNSIMEKVVNGQLVFYPPADPDDKEEAAARKAFCESGKEEEI